MAQKAGAMAVFITQFRATHGLLFYYSVDEIDIQITIPSFEISVDDSKEIVSQIEDNVIVNIVMNVTGNYIF